MIDSTDAANVIKAIRKIDFYKGTNITRWKMRNYLRPQNDTEHESLVAHYAIYVCQYLNVSAETFRKAVCLSVIHDDFEYISDDALGDIPHSCKEESPALKQFVEEHERKIIASIDKIGEVYKDAEEDKLAFAIMEFCDSLDVMLYIEREFKLGNSDKDFQHIYELSIDRTTKKWLKIKEIMNENQNH